MKPGSLDSASFAPVGDRAYEFLPFSFLPLPARTVGLGLPNGLWATVKMVKV
jgi:hypothetical protein